MTNEAVVIGGGIAGTATAIALHRAGWRPVIYEAAERDAGERGVFVTLAVNGVTALRALGLDPATVLARGFATPVIALHGASGRLLAEVPLGGPLPDGTVSTTIRRSDLYSALRAEVTARGIPIEYGARLTGVSGAVAEFADGRTARGDLLVGADGLHSRTREVLDPKAPAPHYLGLLNTGGFTDGPVRDAPPPGVMRMSFGRRAFFGWVTAPDGSVWWFANPPRRRPAEPGEFTPDGWRTYLLELFAGEPAADLIRASSEVLGPWNTRDLRRVPVWHGERIVLTGDAAHAVAPSSGQGASMALEDAVVLGHSLRENPDVPAALAAYAAARRPRVEKVVVQGRRSSSSKVLGPVRAALRDATLPAIMRLLHRNGDPQAWIFEHRLPGA
ncbi:2-polyprenyl-6-methoxyphenol hydroxylase-like FAD-dependent oxidoreductase [Actinoplanes campanulatus]|uniref:2-polyprenyl-6-methoxyphenol hydroxylase-like FAD-dependent oxidoreductase n=1 Tax=Actinoplanes campanulatus TaxID=113559 RepID=A0A7W5FCI5_9ACTN|nr:NAD(P)/FAD-dependent oxidoreductase [Actinoplanes campanulatus]MBB3093250.1 2-polyprenyl-6-methoxyphenol hydroxylase-like FAD-dependent oxidoreductase [Actinoplanes campanulatus]GGN02253.1 FAD-dependent oxidoreductase [Actinoplanes campanulatus]GID33655.1 FAD-dependent oxidoreductase [Actinoplanes campanulatus]